MCSKILVAQWRTFIAICGTDKTAGTYTHREIETCPPAPHVVPPRRQCSLPLPHLGPLRRLLLLSCSPYFFSSACCGLKRERERGRRVKSSPASCCSALSTPTRTSSHPPGASLPTVPFSLLWAVLDKCEKRERRAVLNRPGGGPAPVLPVWAHKSPERPEPASTCSVSVGPQKPREARASQLAVCVCVRGSSARLNQCLKIWWGEKN
jgi:hypothetical protein